MKITIGSDHGGYKLKEKIKEFLATKDIEVIDVGTNSAESVDYPNYAASVSKKVLETGELGILICGTGIGMSIAANKFHGIRAAVCFNEFTSQMAREHNNANVLCIGERTTEVDMAIKIVDKFITTESSTDGRHKRRVTEITELEN